MNTAPKQAFSFDQLNKRAKEKARSWFRNCALDDSWWMSSYEDAVQIGKLLGIHITNNMISPRPEPSIYFNLQARKCGYNGDLIVNDLKSAVEKIKAETNASDETLNKLAAQAEGLYGAIIREEVLRKFTHYYEEHPNETDHMQDWDIGCDEQNFSMNVLYDDTAGRPPFMDQIETFIEGFAKWIFKQLEAEHEHLLSDEYADESLQTNEYFFDESGSII